MLSLLLHLFFATYHMLCCSCDVIDHGEREVNLDAGLMLNVERLRTLSCSGSLRTATGLDRSRFAQLPFGLRNPGRMDGKDWTFELRTPFNDNTNETSCLSLPPPQGWTDEMEAELLARVTFSWEFKKSYNSMTNYTAPGVLVGDPVQEDDATPSHSHTKNDAETKVSLPNCQVNRSGSQADTLQFKVSERKRHKFRASPGGYSWFESEWNQHLDKPPVLEDIKEGDFFVHCFGTKYQVWIWTPQEGAMGWLSVGPGYSPKNSDRHVVITKKGYLSLVQGPTWRKEYQNKSSPIVPPA
ncbi:hypothetical protein CONPUDRAFT_75402 [Coniophora puteana RWD-64-598 SS2]|uniref:Uncharacterized protein n=1 Tax=Coniophora puteana (strain RWD-64-598) TaxID=741705 RepID=A0A5M3MEG5_CONPW|nr:uncharacterized protein CONPUDRAFT_75402 [Coniophora puteana RWD-64-598 SS2]EIW77543.1 hypothetical protein CONPUDRAFT_75402 [Coniophora puteana RWD-64-598 SS2]